MGVSERVRAAHIQCINGACRHRESIGTASTIAVEIDDTWKRLARDLLPVAAFEPAMALQVTTRWVVSPPARERAVKGCFVPHCSVVHQH